MIFFGSTVELWRSADFLYANKAQIYSIREVVLKRLFILRHAKSSWANNDLSDFERPLNERGLRTAPFMGELIAKRGFLPEIIVSSPAERAVKTAHLIKDSSGFCIPLILDDRIYEASPQTLKQIVIGLPNELESAMLVGHNPGIEGFIRNISGRNEPMPTASLAVLDIDTHFWSEVDSDSGHIIEIIRPKEVMQNSDVRTVNN